ncbi:hypothetical protein CXB51_019742 [Gossypium anomalum]|uniref:Uncharacterized protein n=1 Tax=Gossypium anomalum TaxID=47600 RepID=A0A8J5Z085_9ROSI|nr:hypothetical protein CXB51_019742 [Gossypium anomalum]
MVGGAKLEDPIGSEARVLAGYLGILARNANLLPINYESWHHMPDSNKNHALDNIKDRERVGTISRKKQKFTHTTGSKSFVCVVDDEELLSGQKVGRLQLFDITHRKKYGSLMTAKATEIMEKLKDKRAEYETTASNDSSVNLDNIDNRVITEVLGPERYGRLQLKAKATVRAAEVAVKAAEAIRKYDELQLQLQNMMKMFQQNQSQNPPS